MNEVQLLFRPLQASSLGQVTAGVDQISSVVQTNSATAEEGAAASQELSAQAQMLKVLVSQFKLKESAVTQDRQDFFQPESGRQLPAGTGKYQSVSGHSADFQKRSD